MAVGPFTSSGFRGWNSSASTITTVEFHESFDNCTSLTSTAYWFANLSNLTTLKGMEYLHTENVTTMSSMFMACSSLESVDLSHFDTGNVKELYSMFTECSSLAAIDITPFNTHKVTNIAAMFNECSSLETIDLSHFDTRNVTNAYYLFHNCSKLNTIYCNDTWTFHSDLPLFLGCTSLSDYDENNVNSDFARPIALGGYFTPTATAISSEYWMTYYTTKRNFKADANTTVYTATLNNEKTELVLHEVTNKIVPSGNAVILKSTNSTPELSTTLESGTAGDFTSNVLQGSETTIPTSSITTGTVYTLAYENSTLGFYRYTGSELSARKAFLTIPAASRVLRIVIGDANGISSLATDSPRGNDSYYDMQGRRVEHPTKGLYIVNGKKVVIK